MPFHKKNSFIFLTLFLTVLLLASFFKLTVHSSKISLVTTVYADNWWEDWGNENGGGDEEDNNDAGGDENTDPGRDNWWEDDSNNDNNDNNSDENNTDTCDSESWTDEQTSGEFYCNDGKACYKQWSRDSSCNIHEDGEDCQSDSRCEQAQNNGGDGSNSCEIHSDHLECRSDGQIYQTFKDCNDQWVDAQPTGESCDAGGGSGGEEENQGSCPGNQYWDTSVGQCVVNDLAQTQQNDDIYCRDECGGSCGGDLGRKYCTNSDGSKTYDCNDPLTQATKAECQNQLVEEFSHVGLDPDPAGASDLAAPVCGYADLDGGECRGAQFCNLHIQYCDGEPQGDPELGGNCNLVPGLCGVAADDQGNFYVDRPACNPECGANERCMDDGDGAGFCQANTPEDPAATSSQSNEPTIPAQCQGITNPDRLDECLIGLSAQSAPGAPVTDLCQGITNPDRLDECLSKTGNTSSSGQNDATCQAQNASSHYCDGNICIEKSAGWDGSACVEVYKTVGGSLCNNSCSGNNEQSGEAIKLLNCLDETDSGKRAECNQENVRIAQTGQKLDQASLVRASLSLEDCSSLGDDANAVCEEKNTQTRQLARALENISLEDCASGSDTEKSECKRRNEQTIKQSQIQLQLGVEDCSTLSGDKKTNCEFTNYQRNQIAQAAASYVAEDCSKYQNDAEVLACTENNQTRYTQAVNGISPFVGLAEVGASCVYTENCPDGGKKACAGQVAAEGNAPVCKYDSAAASCSACTTAPIDLANKDNKCSDDGQTCLNAPGYICRTDGDCQKRLQAAQQAVANAPIDTSAYFGQKFEDGASCKQVQACPDNPDQEQVCEGKGASGSCDLSQGGGVCSPCQAKGTVKLNKVATCNAENKCEGAPALSGCSNDDQCKPIEVFNARSTTVTNPVGAGQAEVNNQIYNVIEECKTERRRVNDYMNYQDQAASAGDESFALQQSQNVSNSYQDYVVCAEKYVPTGRQAVATIVSYDRSVISASNATNQVDYAAAAAATNIDSTSPGLVSNYQDKLAEQQRVLANLKQAEAAMSSIQLTPQQNLSAILDRSSASQLAAGIKPIIEVQTQTEKVNTSLAETAQARSQYNKFAEADPFSAESNQAYLDFEAKRQQTSSNIDQLASLRGETGEKAVAPYRQQLEQLPTKADEQFRDNQAVSQTNQLANVARSSSNVNVLKSTEIAIQDRADEVRSRGKSELADNLSYRGDQALVAGYGNLAAKEILSTHPSASVLNNLEQEIQRIAGYHDDDPEKVTALINDYNASQVFAQAQKSAQAIKATVEGDIFGGPKPQVVVEGVGDQPRVVDQTVDLEAEKANLNQAIAEVCAVAQERCRALQATIGSEGAEGYAEKVRENSVKTVGLLTQQAQLQQQIYALEKSGGASNSDELTRVVIQASQIATELEAVDPNRAALARSQFNEAASQGRTQNQVDYAANTYANNKDLLIALEKAKSTNGSTLPSGIDTQGQIAEAQSRMHQAVNQMQEVDPAKADAMWQDFNLTTYKIDSLPQGSEFVSSGCIVEACSGNGTTAKNICSGNVSGTKSFDPFCAAQNGNTDSQTAWETYLASNRNQAQADVVAANQSTANAISSLPEVVSNFPNSKYAQATASLLAGPVGLAAAPNLFLYAYLKDDTKSTTENIISMPGVVWNGVSGLASDGGGVVADFFRRDIEAHTPVYLGDVSHQQYCRENTTIIPFFGGGTHPSDCQEDRSSVEDRKQVALQSIQSGATVSDMLYAVSGEKANSDLNQRTLERIAEETGVNLSTPVLYWTDTEKAKFNQKLAGYYGGGLTDVADAMIFPSTAFNEANEAARRCSEEWGKGVCSLSASNASTYSSLTTGDPALYQQSVERAKAFFPGIEAVPQDQLKWVTDQIQGAQSSNRVNILEKGTTLSRDQFESDDAYYNALNKNLSQAGSTLNRDQLIDEMTLANARGQGPSGTKMTRAEIEKAVDTYLALGYYGENVVAKSQAYQWQRDSNNEFNSQVVQVALQAVTIGGPLEFLDPTNPIVEVGIKAIAKTVSVPLRAATSAFDNVVERVAVRSADQALKNGLGVTEVAGRDAIRAYFDARAAGKTIDQAISLMPVDQRTAFSTATTQIAGKLGIENTGDKVIAGTVLDNIFKPQVVGADAIAERGGVIAALTQGAENTGNLTLENFEKLVAAGKITQGEVDALAAKGVFDPTSFGITTYQHEVLGHQVAQEVFTTQGLAPSVSVSDVTSRAEDLKVRASVVIAGEPEARPRIIGGRGDGLRVGQATDEENAAIARILEPDAAGRADANRVAQQWNSLNIYEKEEILDQVAREVVVNQAAARQVASQTPTTGRQAYIQLGRQAEHVGTPTQVGQITRAAQNANAVIPLVGDTVNRIIQGAPLSDQNKRAIDLAGLDEVQIRKAVDSLTDDQQTGVLAVLSQNPKLLNDPAQLEVKLTEVGLSPNEAQGARVAFENLSPAPIPVATTVPIAQAPQQPGLIQNIRDGFASRFGRSSNPAPTTPTAITTGPTVRERIAGAWDAVTGRFRSQPESDAAFLERVKQHPDYKGSRVVTGSDGQPKIVVNMGGSVDRGLDLLRADPRFEQPSGGIGSRISNAWGSLFTKKTVQTAPATPTIVQTTSPSLATRVRSIFRSEPVPTDINQVIVDRNVIVQKRQAAEAILPNEADKIEDLTVQRKALNEENESLKIAQAEAERLAAFQEEVSKRGFLGLRAPDPTKVKAANDAVQAASAQLDRLSQPATAAVLAEREQRVLVARLTIEASNPTPAQIQTELEVAQAAHKKASKSEYDLKTDTASGGKLTSAVNKARQEYVKEYITLTSGRAPSLQSEQEFLRSWEVYQAALKAADGKETSAVVAARANLKIDSVSITPAQAESLATKISNLNKAAAEYDAAIYHLADVETDKAVAAQQIASLKELLPETALVAKLNTQVNNYVIKEVVGPDITTFTTSRPWYLLGSSSTARVQLFVDKTGALIPPGSAIPSDAIPVIGVFRKSGNNTILDHYIVPADIDEKSFVYQQLMQTANPGWFGKEIIMENDGTKFIDLYDLAEAPRFSSQVSAPVVDPTLSYRINFTSELDRAATQLRLAGDNGDLPESSQLLPWLQSIDPAVEKIDLNNQVVIIHFNDGRAPLDLDAYEVKALIKEPNLAIESVQAAPTAPIPPTTAVTPVAPTVPVVNRAPSSAIDITIAPGGQVLISDPATLFGNSQLTAVVEASIKLDPDIARISYDSANDVVTIHFNDGTVIKQNLRSTETAIAYTQYSPTPVSLKEALELNAKGTVMTPQEYADFMMDYAVNKDASALGKVFPEPTGTGITLSTRQALIDYGFAEDKVDGFIAQTIEIYQNEGATIQMAESDIKKAIDFVEWYTLNDPNRATSGAFEALTALMFHGETARLGSLSKSELYAEALQALGHQASQRVDGLDQLGQISADNFDQLAKFVEIYGVKSADKSGLHTIAQRLETADVLYYPTRPGVAERLNPGGTMAVTTPFPGNPVVVFDLSCSPGNVATCTHELAHVLQSARLGDESLTSLAVELAGRLKSPSQIQGIKQVIDEGGAEYVAWRATQLSGIPYNVAEGSGYSDLVARIIRIEDELVSKGLSRQQARAELIEGMGTFDLESIYMHLGSGDRAQGIDNLYDLIYRPFASSTDPVAERAARVAYLDAHAQRPILEVIGDQADLSLRTASDNVSQGVHGTADAVRGVSPILDPVADVIDNAASVIDDLTGMSSPTLIDESRILNQRISQLEARETQLLRESSEGFERMDRLIDETDQAKSYSDEWLQLIQEENDLNIELRRIDDEIDKVRNEKRIALANLEEINIRINQDSYLDEVKDAIDYPTELMATRLDNLASFARATGNTDLAESLENAADVARRLAVTSVESPHSAVTDLADAAVRSVGDGTVLQPATDAAADLIDNASPITRGSPGHGSLISQATDLERELEGLSVRSKQLDAQYSALRSQTKELERKISQEADLATKADLESQREVLLEQSQIVSSQIVGTRKRTQELTDQLDIIDARVDAINDLGYEDDELVNLRQKFTQAIRASQYDQGITPAVTEMHQLRDEYSALLAQKKALNLVNNPVQASSTVVSDAVRAAGDGTVLQPATDAAADLIDTAAGGRSISGFSPPRVSPMVAMEDTVREFGGYTRIYPNGFTEPPSPIPVADIRELLLRKGFTGTESEVEEAVRVIEIKVNRVSAVSQVAQDISDSAAGALDTAASLLPPGSPARQVIEAGADALHGTKPPLLLRVFDEQAFVDSFRYDTAFIGDDGLRPFVSQGMVREMLRGSGAPESGQQLDDLVERITIQINSNRELPVDLRDARLKMNAADEAWRLARGTAGETEANIARLEAIQDYRQVYDLYHDEGELADIARLSRESLAEDIARLKNGSPLTDPLREVADVVDEVPLAQPIVVALDQTAASIDSVIPPPAVIPGSIADVNRNTLITLTTDQDPTSFRRTISQQMFLTDEGKLVELGQQGDELGVLVQVNWRKDDNGVVRLSYISVPQNSATNLDQLARTIGGLDSSLKTYSDAETILISKNPLWVQERVMADALRVRPEVRTLEAITRQLRYYGLNVEEARVIGLQIKQEIDPVPVALRVVEQPKPLGRLVEVAPGQDVTLTQVTQGEGAEFWYRPAGGRGAGAETLINDRLGLVAKYADYSDAQYSLLAELMVVDTKSGLFPEVKYRIVRDGKVIGYVMEKIEGSDLGSFGIDNLPKESKIALLYRLADFYDELGIPRQDVDGKIKEHFFAEMGPAGNVRIRSIDPLPRALTSRGFVDEVNALIAGRQLTPQQRPFLQVQIGFEIKSIIDQLKMGDDEAIRLIKQRIDDNEALSTATYAYAKGRTNTPPPPMKTLNEMLSEVEQTQIRATGRSEYREAKNFGWEEKAPQSNAGVPQADSEINQRIAKLEEVARTARDFGDDETAYQLEAEAQALRRENGVGGTCELTSLPSISTIAQIPQNSNVLGISTGEVLAATRGPCTPLTNAVGKAFQNYSSPLSYVNDFVNIREPLENAAAKLDQTLPESLIKAVDSANNKQGFFSKIQGFFSGLRNQAPIESYQAVSEMTNKFAYYTGQIDKGFLKEGEYFYHLNPDSGVISSYPGINTVPFAVQFSKTASGVEVGKVTLPKSLELNSDVLQALENATRSKISVNQVEVVTENTLPDRLKINKARIVDQNPSGEIPTVLIKPAGGRNDFVGEDWAAVFGEKIDSGQLPLSSFSNGSHSVAEPGNLIKYGLTSEQVDKEIQLLNKYRDIKVLPTLETIYKEANSSQVLGYKFGTDFIPGVTDVRITDQEISTVPLGKRLDFLEGIGTVLNDPLIENGLRPNVVIRNTNGTSEMSLGFLDLNRYGTKSRSEADFLAKAFSEDVLFYKESAPIQERVVYDYLRKQLESGKSLTDAVAEVKASPVYANLISETTGIPQIPVANPRLVGVNPVITTRLGGEFSNLVESFPNKKGVTLNQFIQSVDFENGVVHYNAQFWGYDPAGGIRPPQSVSLITSFDDLKPDQVYLYAVSNEGRWAVVEDNLPQSDNNRARHLAILGALAEVDAKGVPHKDIGIITGGEVIRRSNGEVYIDLNSGTYALTGAGIASQWDRENINNLIRLEDISTLMMGKRPMGVSTAEAVSFSPGVQEEIQARSRLNLFNQELKGEIPPSPKTPISGQSVISPVENLARVSTALVPAVPRPVLQVLPGYNALEAVRSLIKTADANNIPLFNSFSVENRKGIDSVMGTHFAQKVLPPGPGPKQVMDEAIKLNPTADFTKGVYTEVHLGPDGQIYFIPEVANFSEHLASLDGTHSITDVALPSRFGKATQDWWKSLPLSTDTVIAKGNLVKNSQGELELKLFPYVRGKAYERLAPKIEVDQDTDILAKITSSKENLGISKIADLETGRVVEVSFDPATAPTIHREVTYKYTGSNPAYFLPEVESGYVDWLKYSHFNNSSIDANGVRTIVKKDDIQMNIQGTDARTHQAAVRKIFPGAPEEVVQDIISRPEFISSSDNRINYEILGRHTIDNRSKTVQINLIIKNKYGEVNPENLKDFENTFYTSYLQKLREVSPMEQYELRLITSYVNGDGTVAFHNMGPLPVADIDKGLPNQTVAKLGDQGASCQIGLVPNTTILAQANSASNILGVSTGEVLAAYTGPCDVELKDLLRSQDLGVFVRANTGGGTGSTTLIYKSEPYVAKYTQSPFEIPGLLLEKAVVERNYPLFPKVVANIQLNGQKNGYLMEQIEGVPLGQFSGSVSEGAKVALLYKLADFYEGGIPHGDLSKNGKVLDHLIVEKNGDRIRVIDPYPDGLNKNGFKRELAAYMEGRMTPTDKQILTNQTLTEVKLVIEQLNLSSENQDLLIKLINDNIYASTPPKSLKQILAEAEQIQIQNSGKSILQENKNFGWDDAIVDSKTRFESVCDLEVFPQITSNKMVLGISTGEVLAASAEPCGAIQNLVQKIPLVGQLTPVKNAAQSLDSAVDGIKSLFGQAEVPGVSKQIEQASVEDVVNKVNNVLVLEGDPLEKGCRLSLCGYSSDLIYRAAEREGIKADIYQLYKLHEAIGADRGDVFQHGFVILQKDDQKYLADLTFSQFIKENDKLSDSLRPNPTGRDLKDYPAISELLKTGYLPLTDDNLRQYLKASAYLSAGDDYIRKIDTVTANDLFPQITPLKLDRTPERLDAILAQVEPISTENSCLITKVPSYLASANSNVLGVSTGKVLAATAVQCSPFQRITNSLQQLLGFSKNNNSVSKQIVYDIGITPRNNTDQLAINIIEQTKQTLEANLPLLRKASREVAEQAQKYDYVIVSGKSARISKALLTHEGVSSARIVEFSPQDNAKLYKLGRADLDAMTDEDRRLYLRQLLEAKIPGLKEGRIKPSFLIVDEQASTGAKAANYLDLFEKNADLTSEVKYAVFATEMGDVIRPELAGISEGYEKFTAGQLQRFSEKTFTPTSLTPAEKERAYDTLIELDSTFGNSSNTEFDVSSASEDVQKYVIKSRVELNRKLNPEVYQMQPTANLCEVPGLVTDGIRADILGIATANVLGESVYGAGPLCNLVSKNWVVNKALSAVDSAYDGAVVSGLNTLDALIMAIQYQDPEMARSLLKGLVPDRPLFGGNPVAKQFASNFIPPNSATDAKSINVTAKQLSDAQNEIAESEVFGEKLARGGFGIVYSDGKIASKILFPETIADDDLYLAHLREIEVLKNSADIGLPTFYGTILDETGRVVGYRQELIIGDNLDNFVSNGGRLSIQEAQTFMADLLKLQERLGYHGDFSGQNVIIQEIETPTGPAKQIRFIDINPNPNLDQAQAYREIQDMMYYLVAPERIGGKTVRMIDASDEDIIRFSGGVLDRLYSKSEVDTMLIRSYNLAPELVSQVRGQ